MIIEVCCGSVEDVLAAEKGGADRVELNSDLFHGGLTPSAGELVLAKKLSALPVMAMVRPRAGGFCYTDIEYKTALEDCEHLLSLGADGIVFGFLCQDGTVDVPRCKELAALAGGKDLVFHRAVDVTPDWRRALDVLADMGITRILSSGQEPDVFLGADTLREMIEYAAGRIEILPGAGITVKNAALLAEKTGCTQVHICQSKVYRDISTLNNRNIYYGGALYPPEDQYSIIDSGFVSDIRGLFG
jgi:copper homeostasis protein